MTKIKLHTYEYDDKFRYCDYCDFKTEYDDGHCYDGHIWLDDCGTTVCNNCIRNNIVKLDDDGYIFHEVEDD